MMGTSNAPIALGLGLGLVGLTLATAALILGRQKSAAATVGGPTPRTIPGVPFRPGAAAAATTGSGASGLSPAAQVAQDLEPAPAGEGTQIDWFGGAGQDNFDALIYLLASENPSASKLVWALQALCANNVARGRSRTFSQVRSIKDLLQSGLQHPKQKDHTWLFNLGWGRQYDPTRDITRWASTSAGLSPDRVPQRIRDFVQQLLAGKIDLTTLRGKRGETMPPPATWSKITSFLQATNFQQIVAAQQGHPTTATVESTVAGWGNPDQIAEADGVRFYGRA